MRGIGKILYSMRQVKGYNQNDLKTLNGIRQNTLSRYESESNQIEFHTLCLVTNIYKFKIYFTNKDLKIKDEKISKKILGNIIKSILETDTSIKRKITRKEIIANNTINLPKFEIIKTKIIETSAYIYGLKITFNNSEFTYISRNINEMKFNKILNEINNVTKNMKKIITAEEFNLITSTIKKQITKYELGYKSMIFNSIEILEPYGFKLSFKHGTIEYNVKKTNTEEYLKVIGKILRIIRMIKNITQKELESLTHISQNSISDYEIAQTQPTFNLIEQLCNACDFYINFTNGIHNFTTRNIDEEEL